MCVHLVLVHTHMVQGPVFLCSNDLVDLKIAKLRGLIDCDAMRT